MRKLMVRDAIQLDIDYSQDDSHLQDDSLRLDASSLELRQWDTLQSRPKRCLHLTLQTSIPTSVVFYVEEVLSQLLGESRY